MASSAWDTMNNLLEQVKQRPLGSSPPIPEDTPIEIKLLCTQAYSRGKLAMKQPGIFGPQVSESAPSSQKLVLATYFALGMESDTTECRTNISKNHEPEEYYGDRNKYKTFVSQLALSFGANQTQFRTDKSKVSYAASFLRGSAFDWLQPFINDINGEIIFATYREFLAGLEAGFADPDSYATAERELEELAQTASCSSYYSKFVALLSQLKWTEDAVKIHYFRRGLKDAIKDKLVGRDLPIKISDFAALCIQLDNQIEARLREKKNPTGNRPTRNSTISPPQRFKNPVKFERDPKLDTIDTQLNPEPMELDSASRKAYRKANNLCTYCGASGHWVRNCEKAQSKKGKIASASLHIANDVETSTLYQTKN